MSSETPAVEGRSPNGPVNVNYHFSNINTLSESLSIGLKDGEDTISLIISANSGSIPKSHPKLLKDELTKYVEDANSIENLKLTRYGKLSIVTRSIITAQRILNITTLLGVQVNAYIQTETITSRFILHSIDTSVSCSEIAEELTNQGLTILEVRRFLKKTQGVDVPTPTVLVTVIGTTLPEEVKLWFEVVRINLFFDRPRQCGTCFKFNHATRACRSSKVCVKCSEAHTGVCSSDHLKCTNCKGAHAADNKNCPKYIQEVSLQKFRSSQHLTLSEARRRFGENQQTSTKTFAQVVSSPPPDVVTKTDLEAAIQGITTHFTNMVKTLVAELQQSVQSMVETIVKPIIDVVKDMQEKKQQKSLALAHVLEQRIKKARTVDLPQPDLSSAMEIPVEDLSSNTGQNWTLPANPLINKG